MNRSELDGPVASRRLAETSAGNPFFALAESAHILVLAQEIEP